MNNEVKKSFFNSTFKWIAISFTCFAMFVLLVLIISLGITGAARLGLDFLLNLPSRKPEQAGIYTAWIGSLWVLITTLLVAFPVGVGAGIYLEEYSKKNWLTNMIEINISNLAGVPSIIYGLLGLELFVRYMGLGQSILAGSLTLALLILPVIIVSTREAIKTVPNTIREASYALGASKWQTISMSVIPGSFGGILTGIILALSRAIGETAPLIVTGALTYVPFIPKSIFDSYTVLPIQIFNWTSRPQQGFVINAAAAIIVLLVLTFLMNAVAIYLRNRWQKQVRW
ncbi:MAG: phosphate ABC transporter permease PstA [Bacteroidetes bacterium]|nr:phosphate ABC transporter permease PstA [Bacteroidota bacterium]MBL0051518.1 phosphate ABC transporter permease PstA [Bacteroidota bacterium]